MKKGVILPRKGLGEMKKLLLEEASAEVKLGFVENSGAPLGFTWHTLKVHPHGSPENVREVQTGADAVIVRGEDPLCTHEAGR